MDTFTASLYLSFESSHGKATPGKKLLDIWVTDEEGRRIDFTRATGRYFGKIISGAFLYTGFLMAGFTEKSRP